MKKGIILIIACLISGVQAFATSPILPPDTTIYVDGKRIEIIDGERMKIRVYENNSYDGYTESELVFEGHYRDGKSYESRKHGKSINIPIPTPQWSHGFDPHWAGVGLGFANFADESFHVNEIDGVFLNSERSWELNINFYEHSFRLSRRYGWALVTGAGIRWDRYRLDGNEYFIREDGKTVLLPAPPGIHYTKSQLKTTSLTIPLLLEWQNLKRWNSDFFISAGIVGVIKTASSSKVQYRDERDKKHKEKKDQGLYIRPINMDFLFQMGYDWISLYVKYSPFELFENNRGPKIQPVSIGFHLHI